MNDDMYVEKPRCRQCTGDLPVSAGAGCAPHRTCGPQSGFLSALLLAVAFVCIILGGLLADFLLSREVLTLIVVRRLFTAIGKDPGGSGLGVEAGAASWSLSVLLPQGFSSQVCSPCSCPGSASAAASPWPFWYLVSPPAASAKQERLSTSWTLLPGKDPFASSSPTEAQFGSSGPKPAVTMCQHVNRSQEMSASALHLNVSGRAPKLVNHFFCWGRQDSPRVRSQGMLLLGFIKPQDTGSMRNITSGTGERQR